MILHRFCSQEEFDRYMRGELLVNEKDHSKFSKSTSIGFCWFWEEPWYAIEYLSGIVNRDICIRGITNIYYKCYSKVIFLQKYT